MKLSKETENKISLTKTDNPETVSETPASNDAVQEEKSQDETN